ncbi:MAG TPA: hypothetical protein VFS09_11845 [Candidatus Eisenbacteria bacterium]|nr:hypothetical protein [Candidatus Eisenbacteria bacterium]
MDEPRREPAFLASIVREEAIRAQAQAQAQIAPDPARLAEGWERRFVVEGRRAPEYVELYESLGFDVAADPVRREQVADECDDCRLALLMEFRTIYTRPRRASQG